MGKLWLFFIQNEIIKNDPDKVWIPSNNGRFKINRRKRKLPRSATGVVYWRKWAKNIQKLYHFRMEFIEFTNCFKNLLIRLTGTLIIFIFSFELQSVCWSRYSLSQFWTESSIFSFRSGEQGIGYLPQRHFQLFWFAIFQLFPERSNWRILKKPSYYFFIVTNLCASFYTDFSLSVTLFFDFWPQLDLIDTSYNSWEIHYERFLEIGHSWFTGQFKDYFFLNGWLNCFSIALIIYTNVFKDIP